MPDPFEILRRPATPVRPAAEFADHLRARLQRALTLPEGVTVSDTHLTAPLHLGPTRPATEAPAGPAADVTKTAGAPQRLVAYLIVDDGRAAIEWYRSALGARTVGDPIVMPSGAIGHAALSFEGTTLYLAEGSLEHHVAPPVAGGPSSVSLVIEVDDVDRRLARVLAEGAELQRPAADYPHGRNAVVVDPFGHRWMLSGPAGRIR